MPLTALDGLIFALSAVLTLRLGLLLICATLDVVRRRTRPLPRTDPPPTAVLVPAFNEAKVLAGTVRAILRSDHPDFTVTLIDDGSTDGTLALARELAAQDGRVRVLAQEPNQGKAAALRAGLEGGSGAVVIVDADTLLAPDALRLLTAPLTDPAVDAVASNVKVGNRISWLTRWQSLEYIVGLNLARRAQATLSCITTIPGAACAARAEAIAAVGSYSSDTLIEDTDLSLSLLRAGRKVVYQPAAVAFTEAPSTVMDLMRQRRRWMLGYLQCLIKHRRAFLRTDVLGWFGMPNLLLIHLLVYLMVPLSVPSLSRLLVWSGWEALVWGLLGLFGVEVVLALLAMLVDREPLRDLVYVPFRRLVWPWFLLGVFGAVWWKVLARRELGWEKLERAGLLAEQGEPGVIRR